MIRTMSKGHLLVEDLADEDEVVAARARTAEAKPTAEEVAVRAATFGEVACLAGDARIDGVGDEGLTTAEVNGEGGEISRCATSLAQAVGVLLERRGAVVSADRDKAGLADGAAPIGRRAQRDASVPSVLRRGSPLRLGRRQAGKP